MSSPRLPLRKSCTDIGPLPESGRGFVDSRQSTFQGCSVDPQTGAWQGKSRSVEDTLLPHPGIEAEGTGGSNPDRPELRVEGVEYIGAFLRDNDGGNLQDRRRSPFKPRVADGHGFVGHRFRP